MSSSDLVEALVDETRVLGRLLDIAQRDPEAVALDIQDGCRGQALANLDISSGIGERQVSPFAPHRMRRQAIREVGYRIQCEEWVIDQPVPHGDRPAREATRKLSGIDLDEFGCLHVFP